MGPCVRAGDISRHDRLPELSSDPQSGSCAARSTRRQTVWRGAGLTPIGGMAAWSHTGRADSWPTLREPPLFARGDHTSSATAAAHRQHISVASSSSASFASERHKKAHPWLVCGQKTRWTARAESCHPAAFRAGRPDPPLFVSVFIGSRIFGQLGPSSSSAASFRPWARTRKASRWRRLHCSLRHSNAASLATCTRRSRMIRWPLSVRVGPGVECAIVHLRVRGTWTCLSEREFADCMWPVNVCICALAHGSPPLRVRARRYCACGRITATATPLGPPCSTAACNRALSCGPTNPAPRRYLLPVSMRTRARLACIVKCRDEQAGRRLS